ncbi:hypothetical protein B0H11DRAFT_1928977 [Mycena galericulata]|nr:hypothetical protein B0H11DRAFT_1928977 [Mycena galericulata]
MPALAVFAGVTGVVSARTSRPVRGLGKKKLTGRIRDGEITVHAVKIETLTAVHGQCVRRYLFSETQAEMELISWWGLPQHHRCRPAYLHLHQRLLCLLRKEGGDSAKSIVAHHGYGNLLFDSPAGGSMGQSRRKKATTEMQLWTEGVQCTDGELLGQHALLYAKCRTWRSATQFNGLRMQPVLFVS